MQVEMELVGYQKPHFMFRCETPEDWTKFPSQTEFGTKDFWNSIEKVIYYRSNGASLDEVKAKLRQEIPND